MSTRVKGGKRTQFPVPPEGLHQGVCADVWDIYTRSRREEWGGGLTDKTRLVFELAKVNKETGRPYQVSQEYTASLFEKAKLRQHLESWRGRRFSEEELNDFELENLLGVNCQLQVIHNIGNDGIVYANIAAIVPLAPGMTKIRISSDFVRKRDRDKQVAQDEGAVPPNDDDDVPFSFLLPLLGLLPLLHLAA